MQCRVNIELNVEALNLSEEVKRQVPYPNSNIELLIELPNWTTADGVKDSIVTLLLKALLVTYQTDVSYGRQQIVFDDLAFDGMIKFE
jgi:hypothetical protein